MDDRILAGLTLRPGIQERSSPGQFQAGIGVNPSAPYYEILERTQKGALDVTDWLEWFLACFSRAITNAEGMLRSVLYKARFWEKYAAQPLNERQVKGLNMLVEGFEGKLTTSKWAAISRCSQDTAYRDILDLATRGILKKDPARGRSTSYSLTEVRNINDHSFEPESA